MRRTSWRSATCSWSAFGVVRSPGPRVARIALAMLVAGCASLGGLTGNGGDDAGGHARGDAGHDAGIDAGHTRDAPPSDAPVSRDGTRPADAVAGKDATSDAGSLYRAAVLASGPLAYWRMGEAPMAMSAFDETGHGHTGTYAACTLGQPGAIQDDPNTAAGFNGLTSYVDVGNAFGFPDNQTFTVEAWIKPTLYDTSYHPIFVRETEDAAGLEGYGLVIAEMNGVGLERFVSGGRDTALVTTLPQAGVYTYFVGTYDGTNLVVYINGTVSATTADSRVAVSTLNEAYIGGYDSTTSFTGPFDGTIDEVAVYDTALSRNQILTHYLAAMGIGD
jgi:hypothetical protein